MNCVQIPSSERVRNVQRLMPSSTQRVGGIKLEEMHRPQHHAQTFSN